MADPLTVVAGLVQFLHFATQIYQSARGLGLKDEWEQIEGVRFLRAWDVPWAKGGNIRTLINTESRDPDLSVSRLEALPAQEPKSFRFFVAEGLGHWPAHVTTVPYALPVDLSTHPSSPSFIRLRSLWNYRSGALPWLSNSYSMLDPPPDRAASGRPWRNYVNASQVFLAGLMRFSQEVRVVKDDDGRISSEILQIMARRI